MARYESVLDLIGNTPMVDISELSPNPRVTILAKLEGNNPGGSVKDRAAMAMIREPTAVEPVKETLCTRGWATRASPISLPGPGNTCSAPAGNPA